MKTNVTLIIDTDKATCTIKEEGAEEGTYPIISDSDESIAKSVGEALSLYLQGFDPDTSDDTSEIFVDYIDTHKEKKA